MATAFIRPSRDIYSNGSTVYSSGTDGFALVNEEVLDTGSWLQASPEYQTRNWVCGFDAAAVAEIAGATIASVKVQGKAYWHEGWWETPAGAVSTKFLAYSGSGDIPENWTNAVLATCPWTGSPWTSDDIRDCGLRFITKVHRYYHTPYLYQVYLEVDYVGGASRKRPQSIVLG